MGEVSRSLRGRLPFDGDRQETIIKAIVTAQPDYNNSAFLNLSYNVGVREACEVVSRGDQRTAAEEPRHASVCRGFDAPSVVRRHEDADEDPSLQAEADGLFPPAQAGGRRGSGAGDAVAQPEESEEGGERAVADGVQRSRDACEHGGDAAWERGVGLM